MLYRSPLLTAIIAVLANGAAASDGVIEINQASVQANGGFPYTISVSGSYILTGNLTVPVGSTGIVVAADNVSIDLNGFTLTGSGATGSGIIAQSGESTVVRNGFVKGFGEFGVKVGPRSVVRECQILDNVTGLDLGTDAVYFNNIIVSNGGDTVAGGRGMGNNLCDGRVCGQVQVRVQLTLNDHFANTADTTCPNGWHFASASELAVLLASGRFYYDAGVGRTNNDTGWGIPNEEGWARSSEPQSPSSNCNAWQDNTSGFFGSAARIGVFQAQPTPLSVYQGDWPCDLMLPVWCVEDYGPPSAGYPD